MVIPMKPYKEKHEPRPCDFFVKMQPPSSFVACRWCGIRPLRGLKASTPLPTPAAIREVARLRADVEANPSAYLCAKSPTCTISGHGWQAMWSGAEREINGVRAYVWHATAWSRDEHLGADVTVGVQGMGATFDSKRDLAYWCMGLASMLKALHPEPDEPNPETMLGNVIRFPGAPSR